MLLRVVCALVVVHVGWIYAWSFIIGVSPVFVDRACLLDRAIHLRVPAVEDGGLVTSDVSTARGVLVYTLAAAFTGRSS